MDRLNAQKFTRKAQCDVCGEPIEKDGWVITATHKLIHWGACQTKLIEQANSVTP